MIDKVNQLLLKTIDEVGIVDLTYSQEESKEHHDIILPQWHKSIIESDQIDPVIKAYVIAANPEVKKQLDISKTATIEEIYNNLTKSEFSQDTNLPSKIKDAFNKNAKSSSTNIRSRSKSPIKTTRP